MKPFTKRLALVMGLLFTALICCGIVYIDTTQNFWNVSSGLVRLTVSNNISVITVYTNVPHSVGINTNNTTSSLTVQGRKPGTNSTGNGATANIFGALFFEAGAGGDAATNSAAAVGGVGGQWRLTAGNGGVALNVSSNATGGAGGIGQIRSGNGGSPSVNVSNTVGGAGGILSFFAGNGGTPTSGAISRKGGNGAAMNFDPGLGGDSVNTNGGNGGNFNIDMANGGSATGVGNGGTGGAVGFGAGSGGLASGTGNGGQGGAGTFSSGPGGNSAGGGNAGAPGDFTIIGGAGATGSGAGTNSNGGNIYLIGGSPGSGAAPGNTYIARLNDGTGRGGLVIGISNSAVLTNVMFVRTNLDFPSTLAQTDSDIPVLAVTGMTNAIVNVGPPVPAILTGSAWSGFCSNGTVFVRFSVYGLVAKDPGVGDFEVEIKAYR